MILDNCAALVAIGEVIQRPWLFFLPRSALILRPDFVKNQIHISFKEPSSVNRCSLQKNSIFPCMFALQMHVSNLTKMHTRFSKGIIKLDPSLHIDRIQFSIVSENRVHDVLKLVITHWFMLNWVLNNICLQQWDREFDSWLQLSVKAR